MGTLMPLSQTIIGDIIRRASSEGDTRASMGAVFGVTSAAACSPAASSPTAGVALAVLVAILFGAVALAVIWRFLHVPHERREARLDIGGILTLSAGLTLVLLATTFGGSIVPLEVCRDRPHVRRGHGAPRRVCADPTAGDRARALLRSSGAA